MNQILETKFNNKKNNLSKLKKILKAQFYFSIFSMVIIGTFATYRIFKLYKQEKYSSEILNNYNITRLYANTDMYSNETLNSNEIIESSYIIGIIEIPKIDVYYPIFSNYDDNLLRIAPCKFFGSEPGKIGNLCIAGHNYDNNKFFSKIANLSINDEIIIYNNSNTKFSYFVFDIYEVKADDLSPVYSYDTNSRQLTLITCNNINNNRIIVKALNR